ncbi:MAG TPA: hypothetical protein VIR29_01275 [Anseongella sp.]
MTFLYPNVQINHRVIFFLLMLMVAPAVGAGQQIELSSSKSGLSRDGHVRLQWAVTDGSSGNVFLVQQAETEAFSTPRIIYHGPDQATFISGLENGNYYFRVRRENGDWSNVMALEVNHHSLYLTFILLSIGAVVFLLTAAMVIYGSRKSARIQ